MAWCNAFHLLLLIALLGSFRSDVVNGQDGSTTPVTNGDILTTPGRENTTKGAIEISTSFQNGTDADINSRSRDTATTVLMTSGDVEYVTDLVTLSETLAYSSTQLWNNEGTDWSTKPGDTTVMTETDTTDILTTVPTEFVTDVEDLHVSTLNVGYDDLTTYALDDEYSTTFTTEANSFSTTDSLTEIFSDLKTTDQSTTMAFTEQDETNTDGTLDEYATTLLPDSTIFDEGISTLGGTELLTVTDDTQTTIVTQEDYLTSEISNEDVTTYVMDKMSTEMHQTWDDKHESETVTVFEDFTTLIEIEGTEDATISWPSTNGELTEMTTIVSELFTEIEMTDSTGSDDIENYGTERSQDTSDGESSTMMMEMNFTDERREEEEGEYDLEEDMVTEIVFTEEYATDAISTDDKTSNESLFSEHLTTGQTTYDDKTKPKDEKSVTTNSGLSVTTSFPFTTEAVVMPDNTVFFLMKVDISQNIEAKTFINEMEQNLAAAIQISAASEPSNTARRKRSVTSLKRMLHRVLRRQRRALNDVITVTITNMTRQVEDPGTVKTTFMVNVNGTTLSAIDAASQFDGVTESKLSAALGHEVLSIPAPENLPEISLVSLGPLDVPSGALRDFLMITLLVPLTIDISGSVFQTDVANGLESLYLEGMEMSSTTSRKRRGVQVLLDGRIIQIKEVEGLRRRRQAIEDPSEEYVVKLKSVNRPISTKMEVDIVFCVSRNDQVVKAESALGKLKILSLRFMSTVLGYEVKEPGVTLFKDHENHILWLIIIADIAVIVILLIILAIYCSCVKVKRAVVHKQALLSKVDRSTSIEMGFVRIGVQSSDQIATGKTTKKRKSGAHVMHGTAREKVHRKRHRKHGAFISEYRLGSDSSDEDSPENPHLVKPSQIVSHNRVHPDVSALVPYSGTEDDYEKQEYVRRFKKRDADEDMRRQQQLQEQLNKEMAVRLGAASSEGTSLRDQIGEMLDGATNLNITDRMSKNYHKKKRKKKRRNEDAEMLEEDSGSRKRTMTSKKTAVPTLTAATKVTPQRKMIQKRNSSTKPAFEDNNSNQDFEADQEMLYRELCRKWKKERKRLNKFLDEAFIMTTSLLDNSQRIPSPVRSLQRSSVGEEMPPLHESPENQELPTNREFPTNQELSTNRELPPIRQTSLKVAPHQPNPYLYHHSVGVPHCFPVNPSQTQESDPCWSQIYTRQLKEEIQVPLNHPARKSKERRTKHKVDWTQSLTNPDGKPGHGNPKCGVSIEKLRNSRRHKYS